MPRFTGANGPPMARHRTEREAVTRWGEVRAPRVTVALRAGTREQRIRESGDTGDTGPRALSPVNLLISAGHRPSGDTGDTFTSISA